MTERVGMFVNTVPVHVAVDGELPVGPWLAAVQEQLIAGRAFEHLPVTAAQRCSAVPMGEPLYESVLGFQNYFMDGPAAAGAAPVTVRMLRQQEQTGLPLVVSVANVPTATWIRVEYDEHRIDRPTAEWLADRYGHLLTELADAPDNLPLSDLPALTPPTTTPPAAATPAASPAASRPAATPPAVPPVLIHPAAEPPPSATSAAPPAAAMLSAEPSPVSGLAATPVAPSASAPLPATQPAASGQAATTAPSAAPPAAVKPPAAPLAAFRQAATSTAESPVASRPVATLPADASAVAVLRAAGVGAGDRVLLWLPASPELVAAALGGLALGADVHQVPADASPAELADHCRGAAALVVPAGTEVAAPVPVVQLGLSGSDENVALTGRWRGADVTMLAEAVGVASAVPFTAGEAAVLAVAADDPVLLPVALAAINAGARLAFRDPLDPGAGVTVGPGAWRVHGTDATGAFACVAPGGADLGPVPGGWVADSAGRPVPDAVAGELVVSGVPTGLWVRRRLDGTVERLGDRPHNEDVWVAARLREDDTVADAVVRGERAWIVPVGAVDLPALLSRLRRRVPGALLPTDVHEITELPRTPIGDVDIAALARGGRARRARREPPAGRAARGAAEPTTGRLPHRPARRPARHAAAPARPHPRPGPALGAAGVLRDRTAAVARRVHSGGTGDTAAGRAHLRRLRRLAGRSPPRRRPRAAARALEGRAPRRPRVRHPGRPRPARRTAARSPPRHGRPDRHRGGVARRPRHRARPQRARRRRRARRRDRTGAAGRAARRPRPVRPHAPGPPHRRARDHDR